MVNYCLYRLGQLIALALPLKLGYRLAVLISDLHYFWALADRRAVTGNLRAIFPDKSAECIERIQVSMFRNFAKYLVDFFRFEKIDRDYIKKYVTVENRKYLDQARLEGKPAILLTAHLGNWELGGVVVSLSGYPLYAVALPHKDRRVNSFFNAQRERCGLNVIPIADAVKQSLQVLKKGQMLALVGDRNFKENGRLTSFFGKKAYFPEGPAMFSLRTQALIIPGFMVRNQDDTFTLRFEAPLSVRNSGNTDIDAGFIIEQYKEIFENYIRKYPDQWYMFRRFWQQ